MPTPKPVLWRLDKKDFIKAARVAAARIFKTIEGRMERGEDPSSYPLGGELEDHTSARSELAVARLLGMEWTGANREYEAHADVGDCVEVRTIGDRNHSLIIRPGDLELPTVLTYCPPRTIEVLILGWYPAGRAKREMKPTDPTGKGREPAIFIQQADLRCMSILVERARRSLEEKGNEP